MIGGNLVRLSLTSAHLRAVCRRLTTATSGGAPGKDSGSGSTKTAAVTRNASKTEGKRRSNHEDADEKPIVAQMEPIGVDVVAGKAYFWCTCGRSQKQPFCDASHKGTSFRGLKYVAEKDETVFFCACKQSSAPPLCDGTHASLSL
eukprot:Opistho-2@17196